jgi:thiol-disulfide isomerase/thioredoxin
MSQRLPPWIIFLLFPVVALVAMLLIILGGDDSRTAQQSTRTVPSPIPIRTTPVPTVTIVPILDNLAPDLPLKDFEDQTFHLYDLTGQVVVVNFWATWCPPCVEEMPILQAFAEDNPQVVVLGVTDPNDGQDIATIQAFIDEYQLDAMHFGLDQHGLLRLNFNALQLPMTFVLDRQGYVRFRQIGKVTREDLDYYLSELSS